MEWCSQDHTASAAHCAQLCRHAAHFHLHLHFHPKTHSHIPGFPSVHRYCPHHCSLPLAGRIYPCPDESLSSGNHVGVLPEAHPLSQCRLFYKEYTSAHCHSVEALPAVLAETWHFLNHFRGECDNRYLSHSRKKHLSVCFLLPCPLPQSF